MRRASGPRPHGRVKRRQRSNRAALPCLHRKGGNSARRDDNSCPGAPATRWCRRQSTAALCMSLRPPQCQPMQTAVSSNSGLLQDFPQSTTGRPVTHRENSGMRQLVRMMSGRTHFVRVHSWLCFPHIMRTSWRMSQLSLWITDVPVLVCGKAPELHAAACRARAALLATGRARAARGAAPSAGAPPGTPAGPPSGAA
jgi:hypothetical protein